MVYKMMIAKAKAGAEFAYSRESAHAVPASSAQAIADDLNRLKYDLKPGQLWQVYEMDWYKREYTAAGYQRFTRRNGAIYRSRY